MAGVRIAYMAYFIKGDVNRTQFQRAKRLGEKNELYLFLRESSSIPNSLRGLVKVEVFRGFLSKFLPFYILWRFLKVVRLRDRIKVVYTFYQPYSIIEGFLFKLMGFLWIQDIWDHPELPGEVHKIRNRVLLWIAKRVLKAADLIICSIEPRSLMGYGVNPERMVKVTNGIDMGIFKGLNSSKRSTGRIAYVGYVYKPAGIDTLLKSVKIVKEEFGLNPEVVLIGKVFDRESERWVREFSSKNGLKVVMTGEVSHSKVLDILKDCDVCVYPFPRKRELDCIYPIKVFEYMAMGKAIVATDLRGIRRIVKNGFNGILVKPGDEREMAEAIYTLMSNPKLRRKMGSNGRKAVLRYDWRVIHEVIDRSITKACGGSV